MSAACVKKFAARVPNMSAPSREGVTLRALAERGLHRVVTETKDRTPFKLRRASFKGTGLQAGFRDAEWDAVRAAIYQGRGG